MSSGEPKPEEKPAETKPEEELPPPPDDLNENKDRETKPPSEDVWKEDYNELVGPEEAPKPPKKKRRSWGGVIVLIVVLIILLAWTLFSPKVMTQVGDTYTRSSSAYASWGNYTGYRDIWAGNMTWGISLSGHATAAGNASIVIDVLVTKVYEKPGNWFLRGTSITLKNVSVFTEQGVFLAGKTNSSDVGFGKAASVPVTFPTTGSYDLYVFVKFTVYLDMRIGFMPLESVEIQKVYVDFPIVVS